MINNCTGAYKRAENGLQSRSFKNGNHGVSMTVMDCQGLSRIVKDCYGLLWTVMDCYGLLWTVMDCHGLSMTVIL